MTVGNTSTEEISSSVVDCVGNTPIVRLNRLFAQTETEVLAKLELMNPGGSMKDRPARFIIESGLAEGSIHPGSHLVESSSGNFGIALAIAAGVYRLRFSCVVDVNTTRANRELLTRLGADVHVVSVPDEFGGYLHGRIQRVKRILADRPDAIWVNQYANDRNWLAYYHGAGAELAAQLVAPPDYLFAAVSTTGSIHGCARRLRERFPHMRVIAVDAVGSVIFGAPAGERKIPGFGSSRVPELFRRHEIDDVVWIDDVDAAMGCRNLLSAEGIFGGGSTGAVVSALVKTLPKLTDADRVVAIFPDRGDRYLDLVYNDDWLATRQRRSS